MANLCPGYSGILEGPSGLIRCTDFGVRRQQDPLFYDHVIGLLDTIPGGSGTKGEGDSIQIQKTIMRPGPRLVTGGFSFPATKNNADAFFEQAKYGKYFDFTFYYSGEDGGFDFGDCRIASYTFNCTAGDIVNISVEIMGILSESTGGGPSYQVSEKMITWDEVQVTGDLPGSADNVQAISFTISNDLLPIYTSAANAAKEMQPDQIRIGFQTVQGAVAMYKKQDDGYFVSDTPKSITVAADTFSTPITLLWQPTVPTGAIGPVITSVPFVGVDKAFGS